MIDMKCSNETFPPCPVCGNEGAHLTPGSIVLCADKACAFEAEPHHWILLHRKIQNSDARLGRLVRRMPLKSALSHFGGGKIDLRNGAWAVDAMGVDSPEYFDTPEEALEKAGIK